MTKIWIAATAIAFIGCGGSKAKVSDVDMTAAMVGDMAVASDLSMQVGPDMLAATPDLTPTIDQSPPDDLTPAVMYIVTVTKHDANALDNIQINTKPASTDTVNAFSFAAGTMITIVAQPGTNRLFGHWNGGPCDGSTNATCTITSLSANVAMEANFDATVALFLAFSGVVSGNYAYLDNAFSTQYSTNQTVRVVSGVQHVIHLNGSGGLYSSWTYGGSSGDYATLTADSTLFISFGGPTIATTVALVGGGTGTVASSPTGISCSAAPETTSGCYSAFTAAQVDLTATPGASSTFTSWSGCDSMPSANVCRVTLNNYFREVTATFTHN